MHRHRRDMGSTATARLLVLGALAYCAAEAADLDRRFTDTVQPFIGKYCVGCHSGSQPAAQFDLKAYTNLAAVVHDYPRWNLVLDKLAAGQMPPKGLPQPPED